MCVNRCVCANITFREVIDVASRDALTLDEVRERTGAGAGCSMCAPYLRAALRTGRDSFPVLSEQELEALAPRSRRPDRSD